MKKTILILLALLLLGSLSACGKEPDEGVYIAKSAVISNKTVNVEDVIKGGIMVVLMKDGKAVLRLGEKAVDVKWSLDGKSFRLTAADSEYTGTLSKGTMTLEDMSGTGIDITLEKTQ